MTEEFLKMIREESQREIFELKEYIEYTIECKRNKLYTKEDLINFFGMPSTKAHFPYLSYILEPKKTEDGIIMSMYRKHLDEIEEEDTNKIYYYEGTYKYVFEYYRLLGPTTELVARDDPKADFRRYSNIEGVYIYNLCLKDADEFERTHTVLYDEKNTKLGGGQYWITEDFVTTAVRENQEKAKNLVLKKYKTIRK